MVVNVNNVAPTATLTGDAAATEGSSKIYTFTTADVPGDDLSFASGSPSCGTGGVLVGKKIKIELGVEATLQA